jgi:hypothetical protein
MSLGKSVRRQRRRNSRALDYLVWELMTFSHQPMLIAHGYRRFRRFRNNISN